ncbi:MAG TPA: hypothetical protein VGM90_04545 [Kofleriaceae bacterium]|jgi:hypothetical protein
MGSWLCRALVSICALTTIANAQTPAQQTPGVTSTPAPTEPPPEEQKGPKEPKRGDFDAGGQVRFPSGPDENGKYASFNWVALDGKARYYLLKQVTADALIPMAVKKPDSINGGTTDPSIFGGMNLRLEAKFHVPKMPFMKFESEMGLMFSVAYMREGAMLLSDKDFPLFVGDFHPGMTGGVIMKIKLSSLVDFSLLPSYVYQKGSTESLTALQVPLSLILKLGSLVKLSADAGVFTGDDISLRAKNGGRIYLGAALDVKIGPIITHAGAGFASLLTDQMGLYPTIKDSVYVDLNVKYAK